MSELDQVERFIFDRLTAWAPLDALVGDRIHNSLAPQGEPFPYVIYSPPGITPDARGIGTTNLQSSGLWTVKAVDESTSYATVELITQAIHAALHGERDPAGPVLACVREGIISYPEDTDGRSYRHRGGQYRIVVASTSP